MPAGYSLVELLCVCLLVATLAGLAMPQLLGSLSRARTLSAARYLAARMQSARAEAAARSSYVGLRIVVRGSELSIEGYRDGNDNGIRAADVASGADPRVAAEVNVGGLFPGVRAGTAEGEVMATGSGDDVTMFSFAPTGTASSGTVYLRGPRDGQYAVRVLGATGRVRVLRFRAPTQDWVDVR